jgi:hypothetical protein
MNTLWCFGDSQTFGHGCREDGPDIGYYQNYKKEGDDIWSNHLAKELNLIPKNFGICGASNETILDTILDNFLNIKEGDIVIINKTFYERFDIPNKKYNILQAVFGEIIDYPGNKEWWSNWLEGNGRTLEEIETLVNFIYFFATDPLYEKRQNKRFEFIEKLLKEKNIFFYGWRTDDPKYTWFERITNHTNGKIHDLHFSFKGHRDFASLLVGIIKNNGKRVMI